MSKGQADLLRDYVHKALTNKAKGVDATSYANLVKELGALRKKAERDPSEVTTLHLLTNMMHALKDCVSALRDRKHDALLNEVLGLKLWSCHPTVREAVLDFIANLVVANAAFTHTCLQLLVYNFLPPPAPPQPETDQGSWCMPEEADLVQSAVVATLSKVMQMVPTAPTKLLQLISNHLPHKLRDRNTQCLYMTAMLALAEGRAGAPIRDGLLAAAVEHLLSIDVEIRWEDIVDVPTGQEAEEGASDDEEEEEDIFELDGMSELDINATPEEILRRQKQQAADRGGWEGAKRQKAAVASPSGRAAVDETANKLDSLMELMFEHLAKRHKSGHTADLWSSLLSIFERTILHTHRSKFTQYLVFFVASKQPQPCAAAFVDLLLTRLHDPRQPATTRAACAAYTASFLARAAFAPPALVLASLQRLVAISRDSAASCTAPPGGGSGGGTASASAAPTGLQRSGSTPSLSPEASFDSSQHQVFYASIQSVLYILCYQLRTLMAGGTTMAGASPEAQQCAAATRQLVQAQLVPLLNHRLAPLRVCLPSVAAEFQHQATGLGLIDASSLHGASSADQRPQRPLEMFFPFDPYLLKRSSRHLKLKESYVRWQRGQPTPHQVDAGALAGAVEAAADGDGSDGSDGESEDEDDEGDDGHGMSASAEEDSSDDELEGMSVPSDSILSRPGLPATRSMPAVAKVAVAAPALRVGGGFLGKASSTGDHDMGVSYSPGHLGFGAGVGDMTPSGMSPVLVNYISPAGASPMQMTPVMHTGMDAAAARLGRR